MAKDDRFAPPSEPDLPIDIISRPPPVQSAEPLQPARMPAPRQPLRYRRPLNTPLIVWVFALLGALVVFGVLVKKARQIVRAVPSAAPTAPNMAAQVPPTSWHPVQASDEGVLISVKATPKDARIFLDGSLVSSNPIRLTRSPDSHTILVSAPGYESQSFERGAAQPQDIHVQLRRSARK